MMELNQANSKAGRIFGSLKRIARIVLLVSSVLLFISIVLLLVYGEQCFSVRSHVGDIIWPTIIVSIYSMIYALLILIAFLIYQGRKRTLSWPSVKKETVWFILTSLLFTVFYFVNAYVIDHFH